ncbi:hypothetical protein GCM10011351_16730 [Paraliobacillus quinghaiensis]|uniref:Uncharacterized protein n=1 Tax=Paraliobacillus quinghaiensis TaxID=470815 RepID=A0A917TPP2_9BACI|nr:hypothetical protein [Paraliobacillus quinghaiensis]GGM31228.1 hypothetical protein GCM10011351_16730 [Paraliobacillus quinghaiensis]
MDEIFPFLMILFAIGSGLVSFFGKKQEDDNSNKKTTSPRPNNRQQDKQVKNTVRNEPSSEGRSSMSTYMNERKEQLEALRSNYTSDNSDVSQNRMQEVVDLNRKKDHTAGKKKRKTGISLARNISKEGLAESVIMAEVLGSPRAKKPYQNRPYARK